MFNMKILSYDLLETQISKNHPTSFPFSWYVLCYALCQPRALRVKLSSLLSSYVASLRHGVVKASEHLKEDRRLVGEQSRKRREQLEVERRAVKPELLADGIKLRAESDEQPRE